jgi:hypothetical protein
VKVQQGTHIEGVMNDEVWRVFGNVLFAAFLGVVGQLVRVVAGLKKESDQASATGQTLAARFNSQELFTSLGIAVAVGTIAGVLSALQATAPINKATMLADLGAGYSGTDFIEAFMKKTLPGQ